MRNGTIQLRSKGKTSLENMNNSSIPAIEKISAMVHYMFPQNWILHNSNYLDGYTKYLKHLNNLISDKSLNLQSTAITSWKSLCGEINKIKSSTLVVVGTEDDLTIPYNSISITEKIPESILVQIKGGGHGMMHQYPEKMGSIVSKFLFG